jgi:hypothetical protein
LLLVIAQLAYNNKLSKVTSITLYFANYRKYLNLFKKTLPSIKTEIVIKTAEEIKEVYSLL